MNLLLPSQVKIDDITFGEPKSMGDGKMIWLSYKKKQLRIQITSMPLLYSFKAHSEYTPSIQLSFSSSHREVESFHNLLRDLRLHVIKCAQKNCLSWFSKKSINELECNYHDILQTHDKYGDHIRLKLTREMEIYNKEDARHLSFEDIFQKKNDLAFIIRCGGLWINDNRFGVIWKIEQVRVKRGNWVFRED